MKRIGEGLGGVLRDIGRGLAAVYLDLLALSGVALIGFGVWEQYGRPYAAMVTGVLLLSAAVISAYRRS